MRALVGLSLGGLGLIVGSCWGGSDPIGPHLDNSPAAVSLTGRITVNGLTPSEIASTLDLRAPMGAPVDADGRYSAEYQMAREDCPGHAVRASVWERQTYLRPIRRYPTGEPDVAGALRYVVLDSLTVPLARCGSVTADFDLVIPPRSPVTLSGTVTVNEEPPSALTPKHTVHIQAGPANLFYRPGATAATLPPDGEYSVDYEIPTASCDEHVAIAWVTEASALREFETAIFTSCGAHTLDWTLEALTLIPSTTQR